MPDLPERWDRCELCQYEQECFPVLRYLHGFGMSCRQGRKRVVYRQADISEWPEIRPVGEVTAN